MARPASSSLVADESLARRAAANGVATSFVDWTGQRVDVSDETIRAVLEALGENDRSGTLTLTVGESRRLDRAAAHAVVRLESGGERALEVHDGVQLPGDLPKGVHELVLDGQTSTLIVAPYHLPLPATFGRGWGWMVQLYAVRSEQSWGIGDYADMAELATWTGRDLHGALLLCNPVHAMTPTFPIESSPYFPSSRRFYNAIYLRPELTPEYAAADAQTRAVVDGIAAAATEENRSDLIDRDRVWAAKRDAFSALWPFARRDAVQQFRAERDPALTEFATFCAIAEERDQPSWRDWPSELHDPHGLGVADEQRKLAERIDFHAWLQLLCEEQLGRAQQTASATGMPIGVVHDLAVGVDAGGADAWSWQRELALNATIGAPPDAFNQRGQDWMLPPWRPGELARTGYRAYREVVRAVLRHAGGIRVDHVMGLFRLWWIPRGAAPDQGTYVYYDADALLGVLLLEAERAGAVVIGEDLGTVEPYVRETMAARGILGTTVIWFETLSDPADWRELSAASVTTHDLPTAAGFLRGEHVRIRAALGVLGRSREDEQNAFERERAEIVGLLQRWSLIEHDASDEDIVVALHRLLTLSPARIVLASLGDAVRDLRQPNLPGTTSEYPNWRLAVAAPGPGPLTLQELMARPDVRRLAEVLGGEGRNGPPS